MSGRRRRWRGGEAIGCWFASVDSLFCDERGRLLTVLLCCCYGDRLSREEDMVCCDVCFAIGAKYLFVPALLISCSDIFKRPFSTSESTMRHDIQLQDMRFRGVGARRWQPTVRGAGARRR